MYCRSLFFYCIFSMLVFQATLTQARLNIVPNPGFEYYIEGPRCFSAVEPAGSTYPVIKDWV